MTSGSKEEEDACSSGTIDMNILPALQAGAQNLSNFTGAPVVLTIPAGTARNMGWIRQLDQCRSVALRPCNRPRGGCANWL
jgi:hypothetical protein